MTKETLTQERLKKLLRYDPETGIFKRLITTSSRAMNGDTAGSVNNNGYIVMMVDKKNYLAHHLSFLYMTGRFPPEQVDHINHIRDDNRWINLREVTHKENCKNLSKPKNNVSGVMGVHLYEPSNKWCASIRVNGVLKHLGYFKNKNDAIITRKLAENNYNFHVNHGG